MLKWPDAATVVQAVRRWAEQAAAGRSELIRVGYFGSYAHGDWGVGSDLDLVIIVDHSEEAFERRPASWDTTTLPVPADLLVYTGAEWDALAAGSGFGKTISGETVWVYERR